ncbi:MAG: hypothetical protein C4523_20825 [Myxococcales bacterium]|nr:MAG: hypothetical protein C4523_20825 [Myxococcales bacterium]
MVKLSNAIWFVVLLLGAVGCASVPKYRISFENGEYPACLKQINDTEKKAIEDQEGKDHVLVNIMAASCAVYAGDYKAADAHLGKATEVIDTGIGENRGRASLVLWESAKYFKGAIYERQAIYYYRGLINFMAGKYDKARASFNNSLLTDKQTKEEAAQEDNAATFYMLAQTYKLLNDEQNARIAIEKANEASSGNPYLTEDHLQNDNLVILIEKGGGPLKIKDSQYPQISHLLPRPEPAVLANVFIDGESQGMASSLVNWYRQGQSEGLSEADKAQIGKAVAVQLFGNLARAFTGEADTRVWDFIPDTISVFSAKMEKGPHTITLKFPEKEGYQETHYYIGVPEAGVNFVLLRNRYLKHSTIKK